MKEVNFAAVKWYKKCSQLGIPDIKKIFSNVSIWREVADDCYDYFYYEEIFGNVLGRFVSDICVDYDEETENMITIENGVDVVVVVDPAFTRVNNTFNAFEDLNKAGLIETELYKKFIKFYDEAWAFINSALTLHHSEGFIIDYNYSEMGKGEINGVRYYFHSGLYFGDGDEFSFMLSIYNFLEHVRNGIGEFEKVISELSGKVKKARRKKTVHVDNG